MVPWRDACKVQRCDSLPALGDFDLIAEFYCSRPVTSQTNFVRIIVELKLEGQQELFDR